MLCVKMRLNEIYYIKQIIIIMQYYLDSKDKLKLIYDHNTDTLPILT